MTPTETRLRASLDRPLSVIADETFALSVHDAMELLHDITRLRAALAAHGGERMTAQERRDKFQTQLDRSVADPVDYDLIVDGYPLVMRAGYHDGPGAQFFDQNGHPVLVDLIRGADLAAQILGTLNRLHDQNVRLHAALAASAEAHEYSERAFRFVKANSTDKNVRLITRHNALRCRAAAAADREETPNA